MASTFAVPPDQTFFSAQAKTFDDVEITADNKVPTAALCDAAEGFSNLFCTPGSCLFPSSQEASTDA
jgi:hypothetical protein